MVRCVLWPPRCQLRRTHPKRTPGPPTPTPDPHPAPAPTPHPAPALTPLQPLPRLPFQPLPRPPPSPGPDPPPSPCPDPPPTPAPTLTPPRPLLPHQAGFYFQSALALQGRPLSSDGSKMAPKMAPKVAPKLATSTPTASPLPPPSAPAAAAAATSATADAAASPASLGGAVVGGTGTGLGGRFGRGGSASGSRSGWLPRPLAAGLAAVGEWQRTLAKSLLGGGGGGGGGGRSSGALASSGAHENVDLGALVRTFITRAEGASAALFLRPEGLSLVRDTHMAPYSVAAEELHCEGGGVGGGRGGGGEGAAAGEGSDEGECIPVLAAWPPWDGGKSLNPRASRPKCHTAACLYTSPRFAFFAVGGLAPLYPALRTILHAGVGPPGGGSAAYPSGEPVEGWQLYLLRQVSQVSIAHGFPTCHTHPFSVDPSRDTK